MFIDALNSKIQGLLYQLHTQVQSRIMVLGRDKRGHKMALQECVHCEGTQPMGAKRCHPCNNSMLSQKYCRASYRVVEFVAILEKEKLWPSVEPFNECTFSDLVHRIVCAHNDINHTCDAGESCPLLQQLQVLSITAHRAEQNIKGLCLICIKSGRWADNNICICKA